LAHIFPSHAVSLRPWFLLPFFQAVIILAGRYAGKKAVIVKNFDEP
jgi:hypothetical protein